MKNQFNITAIILLVVIVLLLGYIGYTKYQDTQNQKLQAAYMQGAKDAEITINNQIIQSLNSNGFVVFTFLNNMNQTQQVKLAPVIEQQQAPAKK